MKSLFGPLIEINVKKELNGALPGKKLRPSSKLMLSKTKFMEY